MNQIYAIAIHRPCLFNAISINSLIMISSYCSLFSATFHTHLPFQSLCFIIRIKPIFFHDFNHLLHHVVMILPLLDKCIPDFTLVLHVDDVYYHRILLEKPVASMYGLYEVIKLIIDSNKYLSVAISLKVTPRS